MDAVRCSELPPSDHRVILRIVARVYLGCSGSSPGEGQNGYCPNHATGVRLAAGFKIAPLQYVD
jgi:hypothetical protein